MQKPAIQNTGIVSMDKKQALEKAKIYAELITKYYNPCNIILFGSYSRDSWNEDSDIDIAVIFEKIETDKFDIAKHLFKIRRNVDPLLEPVVFDSRHDPSGFLAQIRKEGITLFPGE